METRASYVLIGVVTLLAILAGLGFFLWLAKVQLDRTYARYDIVFDSVAGLGAASPVRFAGVDVGQVLSIDLNQANPSQVRVTIEVAAETPVREGTIATLQSQGVTGVSFVGLEGGRVDAPPLQRDPLTGIRLIPSKVSVVQGLIQDAPDLLAEAISLLRELRQFTSDDNRDSLGNILANVDDATARLDDALTDFATITDEVSKGVAQIAAFTERLDAVAANADAALATADGAFVQITEFTNRLDSLADGADAVLATANGAMQGIDGFSRTALPAVTTTIEDAGRLVASISRLVANIERDPARFFLGNRTPEYSR